MTGTGTGKRYCSRAGMEKRRRVDLVELVTRTATGDYEESLTATRSRGQRRTAGDTKSRTTTRSREQRTVDTQSTHNRHPVETKNSRRTAEAATSRRAAGSRHTVRAAADEQSTNC